MNKEKTMSATAVNCLITAQRVGILSDASRNEITLALVTSVKEYNRLMSGVASRLDSLGIRF